MRSSTAMSMRKLDSKTQVREPSIIHLEIDYLSCPSLRLAVNILKKNNQGAAKLPADFEHEYDLALRSDRLSPPALLVPKTIYINATKGGLYYETLEEGAKSPHKGIIRWEHLPENFPYTNKEIVQKKSQNFPAILAQTLKARHTPSDFKKIILSIEDIENLIDEFHIYSSKRRKSEIAHAKTLTNNGRTLSPEAKAYLVQANKLAQANQQTFERAIAYLMKRVLEQLEEETVRVRPVVPTNNPEETPVPKWRWAAFIMLMTVEFVPALWGNLMYASSSMASLTPYLFFIPPPVMAAIGIISALSMLGGMICFIGPILMKWLKVNYSSPDTSLLSVYKQQLEVAERIDNYLLHDHFQSCRTYQAYVNFSKRTSAHLKTVVLPEKNKNLLTKVTTGIMTALAGIQALSGSVLLAATILGCILGAFTVATCSPVILTAFVASHLMSVFLLASPIALCTGVVSYILRICSTSELLDPDTKEHDAVKKKHGDYLKSQPEKQLNNLYLKKQQDEKTFAMSPASTRSYIAGIREGVKLKKSPKKPTNCYLEQQQEQQTLFLRRCR